MKAARPHGPAARTAPPSAAGLPQAARSGPHNEARARRAPSGQLRPGGRRRSQSQSPPRWHSRPRTATCPGPTSLLLRASRTKRSARRPRRSRAQPSPARPDPTRPAAPPPAARPRHLQHHSGPDGCREATPPEAATGPAGAARSVLRYEDVRPPDTHRSAARRRRVPAYPSAQPRLGRPPPGALIPYAAGRLPIGRLAVARGAGPRRNGGGGERGGEGLLQVRRGAALGGARQLEGRGCALRLRGGPAAVRIGEVAGAAGSRC